MFSDTLARECELFGVSREALRAVAGAAWQARFGAIEGCLDTSASRCPEHLKRLLSVALRLLSSDVIDKAPASNDGFAVTTTVFDGKVVYRRESAPGATR